MYWTTLFSVSENKQITDKDCTDEELKKQSSMCKERYMKWKKCSVASGYQHCKSNYLEDYYVCVDKLNAMRVFLESKA